MRLAFLTLCFGVIAAGAAEMPKKLIEFGWDEPDTEFMREHIAQMQQTPFDGTVFHVNYNKGNGKRGNFTWEGWGTNVFTREDVLGAIEALKQTQFGAFNQNFLRFNTTPARLDWFDDYSAVVQNARLAAEIARDGRCPGILFDIEQYEGALFDFRKQRDASDKSKSPEQVQKSWELYAAQARQRGREVVEAFQHGYPDLVIFLTFGYSLPWSESSRGRIALAECHYGLLAPFLDGMLMAAKGKTRLVDGHELSYRWKTAEQFAAGYKTMRQDLLPIVGHADQYHQFVSASFGLWIDYDWRKLGWDTDNPDKNYFTPEGLETAARAALRQSDGYVWIYSETPRWWSKEGSTVKLPPAYGDALRRARQEK